MTNRSMDTQHVAFVDTNILHYVKLYLQFAEKHDLFPVKRRGDDRLQIAEAIERTEQESEDDLGRSLLNGLAFVHMARLGNVQIQFASISELELMTGRMRGRALLRAASEGLPDRMWNRFRAKEIRRRLSVGDARRIMRDVEDLSISLGEVGLSVHRQDGGDHAFVVEVAKAVAGAVYMDPVDCIVYSSSIVAQAEQLFTGDGYLRQTVNLIANFEDQGKYRDVRGWVVTRLREVMGWGEDSDVVLPTGVGLNRIRKKLKNELRDDPGHLGDEDGRSVS